MSYALQAMSTSSETTQPTLFSDEPAVATDATLDIPVPATSDSTETTGCPHIAAVLADPRAGKAVLDKYKTVVGWHARRIQDTSPPAKRRKVCRHRCPTRFSGVYVQLRSLRLPVIPATQPCPAHLSVFPVPMRAVGRTDMSPTTCTRHPTLSVRPSHLTSLLTGVDLTTCPIPGVDTRSGSVFCSDCDDFICDATIDATYLSTVVLIEEQLTRFQGAMISLHRSQPLVTSFVHSVETVKGSLSTLDAKREGVRLAQRRNRLAMSRYVP